VFLLCIFTYYSYYVYFYCTHKCYAVANYSDHTDHTVWGLSIWLSSICIFYTWRWVAVSGGGIPPTGGGTLLQTMELFRQRSDRLARMNIRSDGDGDRDDADCLRFERIFSYWFFYRPPAFAVRADRANSREKYNTKAAEFVCCYLAIVHRLSFIVYSYKMQIYI